MGSVLTETRLEAIATVERLREARPRAGESAILMKTHLSATSERNTSAYSVSNLTAPANTPCSVPVVEDSLQTMDLTATSGAIGGAPRRGSPNSSLNPSTASKATEALSNLLGTPNHGNYEFPTADSAAAYRYATHIVSAQKRRREHVYCLQVHYASPSSEGGSEESTMPRLGTKIDSFYFSNPSTSIGVVVNILSEACALILYCNENPPKGKPVSIPSTDVAGNGEGEQGSNIPFAMAPASVCSDYLQRLSSTFLHYAEKGKHSYFLRSFTMPSTHGGEKRPNNSDNTCKVVWNDLETVTSMVNVLPSDPLMPHDSHLYLVHRRILLKALQRLYLCVFLLIFNIDEVVMRPESYTDLYAHYFPAILGVESAQTNKTNDDDGNGVTNALRVKRYRLLEECFFFIAFIYVELEGLCIHGYEACTAALLYAPHNAALWMLRAVFLTRQRSYKAALNDLDIATTLTETRLNLLHTTQLESETPPHHQRGDSSAKKSKVSHCTQAEWKTHSYFNQTTAAANEGSVELKKEIEACERRLRDIHRQRLGVKDLVGEFQARRAVHKSLNLIGTSVGVTLSNWASHQ
ncbi:unnamed protein product [Phytomonas sp. Hart1]|nr:unnamed protein product [Phytomonas sp. Hart1]|eukprot:CCW71202.1 unnamed protein product [Phytomonas sp. isolate Hart1]